MTLNLHIMPYLEKKKLRVIDMTPACIQQYVSHKLKQFSPDTISKHLANISKSNIANSLDARFRSFDVDNRKC